MSNFFFSRQETGLLVIDVQEKLFGLVEHAPKVLKTMQKVIESFQILNIPIFVTEQYPKGLGSTISELKSSLGQSQKYLEKTSFSCLGDPSIQEILSTSGISQWVLMGIEAHVCVLQSAKDLLDVGKQVVVLKDAISSRSEDDFSTAIAEMRECGARISSSETILFELLRDAKAPEFKEISQLIKSSK